MRKVRPFIRSLGIIGRLAQPRKIVTNYHSGGTPLPIETLLTPLCEGIWTYFLKNSHKEPDAPMWLFRRMIRFTK